MKNDRWGDKFVAHSIAFSQPALHVSRIIDPR